MLTYSRVCCAFSSACVLFFIPFVETVRAHGAGYVDYFWQWKDDSDLIVPKVSYVKGFAPWGWIVGTGMYVQDVNAEIAYITQKITQVCLFIIILIAMLSLYIIWQSLRFESENRKARDELRSSEEKFRTISIWSSPI